MDNPFEQYVNGLDADDTWAWWEEVRREWDKLEDDLRAMAQDIADIHEVIGNYQDGLLTTEEALDAMDEIAVRLRGDDG